MRMVDYLLQNNADFLCVLGTTAETPTLTEEEKKTIKKMVIDRVNGRIPILLGVGGNNTRAIVETLKNDDFTGVDAILSVVPYYNKPSQEGIYQHYKAIAEASNLPVIVYNVPSRTVAGLTVETSLRLAQLPNIIAIKDCTGIDALTHLVENAPQDFLIYTGEDGQAFHAKAIGAQGVISVAAHTNGDDFYEMFAALDEGKLKKAAQIQRQLLPKIEALFSVTSPAPLKAVLNSQGFEVGPLRLPLVACTEEEKAYILPFFED